MQTAGIQYLLEAITKIKRWKKTSSYLGLAAYHRYSEMKAYLEDLNKGLEEKDWKVTCLLFESNAPEQNPVEDIWLKGKNFLRRHFYQNKTFQQVKESFFNFLNNQIFDCNKLGWYW